MNYLNRLHEKGVGKIKMEMNRERIAKRARMVNYFAMITTFAIFIVYKIIELADLQGNYSQALLMNMIILYFASIALSLAILIFAIVTVIPMKKANINGGVLMIISSIILLIFMIFEFLLGIIIFILSGLSIKHINESLSVDTKQAQPFAPHNGPPNNIPPYDNSQTTQDYPYHGPDA